MYIEKRKTLISFNFKDFVSVFSNEGFSVAITKRGVEAGSIFHSFVKVIS